MESVVDLSNVVAVVTGSSRGIGKGVAMALGGYGATVYITVTFHGALVRLEPMRQHRPERTTVSFGGSRRVLIGV